jgi:hypothetical protein
MENVILAEQSNVLRNDSKMWVISNNKNHQTEENH